MKEHTYATDDEIAEVLSKIVPKGHSVTGYTRDEQFELAKEVVRQTGKSVRMNAAQLHPSTPISTGEKIFRFVVTLIVVAFAALFLLGWLVAIASKLPT